VLQRPEDNAPVARAQREKSRGCFPCASQSSFLGSSEVSDLRKSLISMVGAHGLEPWTRWLRVTGQEATPANTG